MKSVTDPLGNAIYLPDRYVAKVCPKCGQECGGRGVLPGLPLPPAPEPEAICPDCGTGGLVWGAEHEF